MQEFIKDKIKALPPLSDTTLKVQQICADPDGSLNDLSKVVQADPMLTANILRSANSPLYGFSREITTIERAVSLFGMVTIRGFALNAAMKKTFKIDLGAYGLSEGDFLSLCTFQNSLASGWLMRADSHIKNVCIPASFLLEIGKLIISSALASEQKAAEFKEKAQEAKSLEQLCNIEREFVGFSSYEISAMVFDRWALDIEMVQAIGHLREPKDCLNAAILQVIVVLSNAIRKSPDDESIAFAYELCDKYKLNKKALEEAILRLKNV